MLYYKQIAMLEPVQGLISHEWYSSMYEKPLIDAFCNLVPAVDLDIYTGGRLNDSSLYEGFELLMLGEVYKRDPELGVALIKRGMQIESTYSAAPGHRESCVFAMRMLVRNPLHQKDLYYFYKHKSVYAQSKDTFDKYKTEKGWLDYFLATPRQFMLDRFAHSYGSAMNSNVSSRTYSLNKLSLLGLYKLHSMFQRRHQNNVTSIEFSPRMTTAEISRNAWFAEHRAKFGDPVNGKLIIDVVNPRR